MGSTKLLQAASFLIQGRLRYRGYDGRYILTLDCALNVDQAVCAD